MTDFSEITAGISFSPATSQGRGFLAPLARTTGHFLYLLGRMSDTVSRRPTENQITQELESLNEHLSDLVIPDYLSTSTKERMEVFKRGIEIIRNDFLSWGEEERINNLRSFCNRIIQIQVHLDREILGLTDSDAGQSL